MMRLKSTRGIVLGWILLLAPPGLAQSIIPDNTLGRDRSQVISIDETHHRVEAGTIQGSNLFHSFRAFGVPAENSVYFANPQGITDIFSRVTGDRRSDILGTLGVAGNANLFLLNPNGILFGPSAQLDISGSFVGTTAHSIRWGSGLEFSATQPQAPPILALKIKPGLQFGSAASDPGEAAGISAGISAGIIESQAALRVGRDLRLEAEQLNLEGQLYAGGDLTLRSHHSLNLRDRSTAPLILSAGGSLILQGDRLLDIFALNHPSSLLKSGQDLILRSAQSINGDARYSSGGSFQIQQLDRTPGPFQSPHDPIIRAGGDVSFTDYTGTSLHILAGGQVTADNITITGAAAGATGEDFLRETVTLSDGQALAIDGGTRPTLDIRAGVQPNAIGNVFGVSGDGSGFTVAPTDSAPPTRADINLETVSLEAPNGQVFLTTQYQPNSSLEGGSIAVGRILGDDRSGALFEGDATDVAIDSRQNFVLRDLVDVSAATGSPGELNLLAAQDIQLDQSYLTTNNNGSSAPGNINIQTGNLTALNGSQLRANTAGFGDAGTVTIEASGDVTFDNLRPGNPTQNNSEDRAGIDNRILDSGLDNQPSVKSGGVLINAGNINLLDGAQIQGRVEDGATGESGDIRLNAEGTIEIVGVSPEAVSPRDIANSSSLVTSIELDAQGKPGDIFLQGRQIQVRGGGVIQSNTRGLGNAGNILVQASESITIQGGRRGKNSSILSRVSTGGQGKAGNVRLEAPIVDILNRGSVLSNSEPNNQRPGEGNGGTVTIIAPDRVRLINDAVIAANVDDSGSFAGDILIQTGLFEMRNGAQIFGTADGTIINPDPLGRQGGGTVSIIATEAVRIVDDSAINTQQGDNSTGNAGKILIEAPDIDIRDGSEVRARSEGNGNGGDITLNALGGRVRVQNNSILRSSLDEKGFGEAGNIEINASVLELLDQSKVTTESEPNDEKQGQGNGGSVTINASERITLQNQAAIVTRVDDTGSFAGDVTINTGLLELRDKSEIFTAADGTILNPGGSQGAGNVSIVATIGVKIVDSSSINSQQGDNSIGAAGSVSIKAPNIDVLDKSDIRARSEGTGDGGRISLDAVGGRVRIQGNSEVRSSIDEKGIGQAGDVEINTSILEILDNSKVTAESQPQKQGRGNGGSVTINAPGRVTLKNKGEIVTRVDDQGSFAGDVTVNTGLLELRDRSNIFTAADGKIENPDGRQGAGDVSIIATESIEIVEGSSINSQQGDDSIGAAGRILIEAPSINVLNGSEVRARSEGKGDAGGITLRASDGPIRVDQDSEIRASLDVRGIGSGGDVLLEAPIVEITNESSVLASAEPNSEDRRGEGRSDRGNAGSVTIRAPQRVSLLNRGEIRTSVDDRGSFAGDVSIQTGQFEMRNGSVIAATADGEILNEENPDLQGGGNINLVAAESIEIDQSQVSVRLEEGAIGKAGNILINAPDVSIFEQSEISSVSDGNGDGGSIEVVGDRLTLSNRSQIDTSTRNVGDAGLVDIKVKTLTVERGGQISSSTTAAGNGGNIEVEVQNEVTLSGQNSGFFATGEAGSTGNSGNISVTGTQVNLQDGAQISIRIQEGTTGDGGSVNVSAERALLMRNQGLIATDSRGEGNGGNVEIEAPFVIGLPGGNSDIIANARQGSGGNIEIEANAILNFERQDDPNTDRLRANSTNDISASSEFGSSGSLSLAGLDVDPSRGTAQLPIVPSSNDEVDRSCSAAVTGTNRFTATGRSGIPLSPQEPLQSLSATADWVGMPPLEAERVDSSVLSTPTPSVTASPARTIVEATELRRDRQGQITLLAAQPIAQKRDARCLAASEP